MQKLNKLENMLMLSLTQLELNGIIWILAYINCNESTLWAHHEEHELTVFQ